MSISKEKSYKRAQKKVKKIKAFYIHLLVYIISNVYMSIVAYRDHGIEGVGYTLMGFGLFWGIGLLFHWYGVFGKSFLFSKAWEKRKIEELMMKDK